MKQGKPQSMPLMGRIFEFVEAKLAENNARTPFNGEIKVIKDLVYKETEEGKLFMDVYLPSKKVGEKSPVVFDIPGGGWMINNRARRSGYATLYAVMGAVVFVIDHRYAPANYFPEFLKDAIDGLNFITTLESAYSLDLSDVTVTGDSSGGHLAASIGCAATSEEYRVKLGLPELKVKPARLVLISGAFGFNKLYKFPVVHTLFVRHITGKTTKKAFREWEYFNETDPYNCVDANFPECYISGGIVDPLCGGEVLLSKKLTELGVKNVCYVGKNISNGHCYVFNLPNKYSRADLLRILTWYYESEKARGTDLFEGLERVQYFLENYHLAFD